MITGLRLFARRTIAARPMPTPSYNAQQSAVFRTAFGPGFQAGMTEQSAQQAARR